MNPPSHRAALVAAFALITSVLHAQVPQLVNYQGRVAVGAVNFDGNGQFKFALVNPAGTTTYWSNDGTGAAGSQPAAAVGLTVTKGLYSVLLGDTTLTNMTVIPASVFSNGDVRLRVWFNDGTNGSQLLAPDQRLAPAAYLSDGAVTSTKLANGAVGSTQLAPNSVAASNLAPNAVTFGSLLTGTAPANGQVLSFNGSALNWITPTTGGGGTLTLPYSQNGTITGSGALFGISNSANGVSIYGVAATGVGVFGSSTSGDGIFGQSNTGGNGVYGDNPNGNGVAATSNTGYAMWASSNSNYGIFAKSNSSDGGHFEGGFGAYGVSATAGVIGVYGLGTFNGMTGVANSAIPGSQAYGVKGIADTIYNPLMGYPGGIGLYGRGSLYAGYFEGDAYVTGILYGHGVYGNTTSTTSGSGVTGVSDNATNTGAGVSAQNNNGGFGILVHSDQFQGTGIFASGALFAGYFSGNIGVTGNAKVGTLTITGGADLAEPFQMSEEHVPKGTVMVIDEETTGRLKPSTRSYDTRVAGIVSGANGINPGIALHQQGVLDGDQNVALSGRVYVLADATGGAIKPGDLLTTSESPGHAMKVTDHVKAQGAIIGKAMSSLNEGIGTVLVLVTLQ